MRGRHKPGQIQPVSKDDLLWMRYLNRKAKARAHENNDTEALFFDWWAVAAALEDIPRPLLRARIRARFRSLFR